MGDHGRMARPDRALEDLVAAPWCYPGTAAACSGLLVDGELLTGDSAQAPRDGEKRSLVVAVGSNASPAVLHRKLAGAAVSTVVPFVRVTLRGLGIGHSGHVSRAGYVPAAPFADRAAGATLVGTWLEAQQLRALDATEPNYVRVRLAGAAYDLEPDCGERPADFSVYVSRWGVLRGEGDRPLTLTAQAEVFAHLAERSAAFRRCTGTDDVEVVMRRLAGDAEQREALLRALRDEGLVVPSGLEGASPHPGGP